VLDSLRRSGRATTQALADDTGRTYLRVQMALYALLRNGLVARDGWRSLGRAGSTAWRYAITRAGRYELGLRERAGRVPGVTYTGSDRLGVACTR